MLLHPDHRANKMDLLVAFLFAKTYLTHREVGAGERLANPVRSGRKQPQRAPLGSMSSLSPFLRPLELCNRPQACGASIFAKMKSSSQRPSHLCVCFNRAGSLFTQTRQSGFAVCPQFDHKTQDGHSRSPTSAKTMDQNTTAL